MHLLCHGFEGLPMPRRVARRLRSVLRLPNECPQLVRHSKKIASKQGECTASGGLSGSALHTRVEPTLLYGPPHMDTGSISALIDDMAKRFSSALPPGISNLRADVERNFRSA